MPCWGAEKGRGDGLEEEGGGGRGWGPAHPPDPSSTRARGLPHQGTRVGDVRLSAACLPCSQNRPPILCFAVLKPALVRAFKYSQGC